MAPAPTGAAYGYLTRKEAGHGLQTAGLDGLRVAGTDEHRLRVRSAGFYLKMLGRWETPGRIGVDLEARTSARRGATRPPSEHSPGGQRLDL